MSVPSLLLFYKYQAHGVYLIAENDLGKSDIVLIPALILIIHHSTECLELLHLLQALVC